MTFWCYSLFFVFLGENSLILEQAFTVVRQKQKKNHPISLVNVTFMEENEFLKFSFNIQRVKTFVIALDWDQHERN